MYIPHSKSILFRAEWNEQTKSEENYERIGLVADPNTGFGRNKKSTRLAIPTAGLGLIAAQEEEDDDLDDDLKAAMAKARSSGKAGPKRITPHQRQIIEALLSTHGDDVEAMSQDRRLNTMQHSQGKLIKLIESYHYWSENSGVDFRVPSKRLW